MCPGATDHVRLLECSLNIRRSEFLDGKTAALAQHHQVFMNKRQRGLREPGVGLIPSSTAKAASFTSCPGADSRDRMGRISFR